MTRKIWGLPAPAVAIVVLLLAGAGGLVAVRESFDPTPVAYEGNARRFLDLTSAGGAAGTDAAAEAAGLDDSSLAAEAAPIPGDFTPAGWRVRPAGRQIPVFNFPLGLAATPDGNAVLVSSDSGGMQGLTRIDAASGAPVHYPAQNLFMGQSVVGDKLYASGGNANRVFRYSMQGGVLLPLDLTEAMPFPVHANLDQALNQMPGGPTLPATDGIRVTGYPGNSVVDGKWLIVAGTLSETSAPDNACPGGRPKCARLSVIDTSTDVVVARVPVGLDAYGLTLDPQRRRLYVSNWADEAGRGAGKGTVSVVDVSNADPAQWRERSFVKVGHHPTAVQLSADRTRLFVTNTNDDTISVINVAGDALAVIATESVRAAANIPVGAYPNALALAPDGSTLFVALAGMNAVEVLDGHTASRTGGQPTYIPTGWYPSALAITGDADDYKLWIANAKGAGAATKSTGLNMSIGHELPPIDGTVSVVDLPVSARREAAWTAQVGRNKQLNRAQVDPCSPRNGIRVSEVLCPPKGQSSPVKHVVYIVTENKTFDQYFGDLDGDRYDTDPKYLLYGEVVTPNHHALAERYSLSDRFFSDAQVSVTGHSWTSGAIATDYNEKTFEANYDEGLRGGRPGEEEDELEDPEGGYIFEAFKRAGTVGPKQAGPGKLSMAIYGESTARESGDMNEYKAMSSEWGGDIQYFDSCRAELFITGRTTNGLVPDDAPEQFQDCGARTMRPEFNLAGWTDEFDKSGRDVMPNFIYMTLPVNHTLGTNLGSPTPASMVADNDHTVGRIVEALSNSPFWESTVVMQTEDDTQAAGDHISPLRDYLSVVGPWAKPGPNHQWGSFPSLLRTIEQIFGVEPITLFDKLAFPQHGAFRTRLRQGPDTEPFEAITPLVPFAINQLGAPGQAESEAMDWSTYDRIDMDMLNAILYAVARGTPFVAPPR